MNPLVTKRAQHLIQAKILKSYLFQLNNVPINVLETVAVHQ